MSGAMSPTAREIRTYGTLLAVAICLAWILCGGVGWWVLLSINSALSALPTAAAVSGLLALPVAALLGWRRAVEAIRGKGEATNMAVGVVLLADLEVLLLEGLAVAIGSVVSNQEHDPMVLAVNAVYGTLLAVVLGIVVYLVGLLIFGLPGLALAAPSAWLWQRTMRKTFKTPTPEGGDRGSGDPRR